MIHRLTFMTLFWACAYFGMLGQVCAFGTRTHQEITKKAVLMSFQEPFEQALCGKGPGIEGFVAYVYNEIVTSDSPFVKEFLKHWPKREAFTASEFKGFLDISRSEDVKVAGLDFIPCEDDGTTMGILVRESTRPDEDGRNQNRVLRDGKTPEDPIVLDMGGLSGLASQAHAHYVLAEMPYAWLGRKDNSRLSSSAVQLLKDPRYFGIAKAVDNGPITLGADMAMQHFLLALLASSWPDPSAKRLSLSYLGHALHYVQDAADPLHTVQAGHTCIVLHAIANFSSKAFFSFGGYFSSLKPPVAVITDMISNTHLWTEAFWDKGKIWLSSRLWPPIWSHAVLSSAGPLEAGLLAAWRAAEASRALAPETFAVAYDAVPAELLRYGVRADEAAVSDFSAKDENKALALEMIGRTAACVALSESLALLKAYEDLVPQMVDPDFRKRVAGLLASKVIAVQAREKRLEQWLRKGMQVDEKEEICLPWLLALELSVFSLLGACFVLAIRKRRRTRLWLRLPTSLP